MSDSPRYSPLNALHEELGASFTDFAGWQMPVRYDSDLAEHHAVRTSAGIFDISHMAEIAVYGPAAGAFLDYALAGKLSAISLGQAKYSLLLNEDGGIIDDLVVYRLGETRFLVVANAGNRFAAVDALIARVGDFDVTVIDESDATSLIAVQGPASLQILLHTVGLSLAEDAHARPEPTLETLKYYASLPAVFLGHPVLIGRTGYTGEDGFELYIDQSEAAALWIALSEAGEGRGLVPTGLACRDTLRLEAGMPLYGHELGLETAPVQAGLGRVVALTKEGDFVGRTAIERGVSADAPVLVGLVGEGKRAARANYEVFSANASADTRVGVITSGALSPTLGYPVAMAYVHPSVSALGTVVFVDIRGTRLPYTVTQLPFYRREKN
ncbi:glycine cleavage system aminomethyltransferase GcvT [Alpinimonas psychrophila]|uniref:Aminomethyltransferase n=1 Tax=Alpinimonas psychrophila TaxID=748908 RepID=A0A7W3JS21_9MICO|nr:glycine cleavage system aminomethyltransferase GcvT [Alpinimonas psychrophila]MBA8828160.1 aminomethyltransferase [Alpinimonas psychrophila]